MKKVIWLVLLLLVFVVSACGQAETAEAVPTIVLEEAGSSSPATTESVSSGGSVASSAIVVPVKSVNLAFTTVGRVTEVNVQVGDEVKAGTELVRLDTAVLEARVHEAEANLAAADIQVKYLIRVGTTEQHLEVAQNDVARAQALVDSAKAVLAAQTSLAAPFDGMVISVDTAVYETVTPGQTVMVLGDLSKYRIETTDLSERDVTRVQVGQPAVVFIEALGEEFTGSVVDIDRISSTLGGDVVYKVTIELDEQPAGLLWGMSADVKINTEE